MSRINKAVTRLKRKPTDYTWSEAKSIMEHFGYQILEGEGSRLKFYHPVKNSFISIHKPHNPPTLREYQIKKLIDRLKEDEFI